MQVDKLIIECHKEYVKSLFDPIKKSVMIEAIKDIESLDHNPSSDNRRKHYFICWQIR